MILSGVSFQLPKGQSAFLWGARKTGKSTWLHAHFPDSVYYDFLQTDVMLEMSRHPAALREQLLARDLSKLKGPVILDEATTSGATATTASDGG